MNNNFLIKIPKVIRWILLPFICILGFFLGAIITSVMNSISGAHSIDPYWTENLSRIVSSAGIIYSIIYFAPSHIKIILKVTRVCMILVYIGLFVMVILSDEFNSNFFNIMYIMGNIISFIIGLFINKLFSEEPPYNT